MKIFNIFFTSFFVCLLCLSSSIYAVMVPLSTAQLAEDSNVILVGKVSDLHSYWNVSKTFIYTRAEIVLHEVIKGNPAGEKIHVEFPGGEVGDIGMVRSDQPKLNINERVLLFLRIRRSFDENYGNVYGIVGSGQGKYRITPDGFAEKGGFTIVDPGDLDHMAGVMSAKEGGANIIDTGIPVEMLVDKILGKNTGAYYQTPELSSTETGVDKRMYSSSTHWGTDTVLMKINVSGGPSYAWSAIFSGMNAWSRVSSSALKWEYAGATTRQSSSADGVNVIYFGSIGGSTLGYSDYWTYGGLITNTDIRIRYHTLWPSQYICNFQRLRALTMHELGHSLGLNHVYGDSIMVSVMSDSLQHLFTDDINAVSDLYPGGVLSLLGDYNGDGKQDLLWRNTSTGMAYVWLLDGVTAFDSLTKGVLETISLDWEIKGLGDFNNDGKDDILWRKGTTGEVYVWLLNGVTPFGSLTTGSLETVPPVWKIKAVTDFNGDGKDDILWRNASTGEVYIWLLDGVTDLNGLTTGSLETVSSDWLIEGIGDFNNDNKSDLLWRNQSTGEVYIWLLDGVTALDSLTKGSLAVVPLNWKIKGLKDFDGDGKDDIVWRNADTGEVYIWLLDGVTAFDSLTKGSLAVVPLSWKIKGIEDVNGDGRSDLIWRSSASGEVYIWLLNGITAFDSLTKGTLEIVGLSWKINSLGDFNADGKCDLLWRNVDTGEVYIWLLDGVTAFDSLTKGTLETVSLDWMIRKKRIKNY